jgi:hypothetical protein
MKIFYFYNNDFVDLLSMFLESMRDDWDHYAVEANFKTNLPAGGRVGDFLRKYLLDRAFEITKEEEIFTMCDIDIFFYKKLIPVINNIFNKDQKVKINSVFENKSLDIVFQRETKNQGCNMGVMSMKNNAKVRNFWKEVYDMSLSKDLWDQPVMNNVLYKNVINKNEEYAEYVNSDSVVWHTFDTSVWNWSINIATPETPATGDIILHHANCVVSKADKIKQINSTYKEINSSYKNIEDSKVQVKTINLHRFN